MVKKWLVIFRSHPEPADITFAKVAAKSMVHAIYLTRKVPQHPWHLVEAHPWPRGCRDVDQAVMKIAASR